MLLLDFPPEIFQAIVHEVVSKAGIEQAWLLRIVCRAFAREIFYNVYTKQPSSAFRCNCLRRYSHKCRSKLDLSLYLQIKTKYSLDTNPGFTRKCAEVITWLCKELGLESITDQEQYSYNVCKAITSTHDDRMIRHRLFGHPDRYDDDTTFKEALEDPITAMDKVAVLAALGESKQIHKLLPELNDATEQSIFGSPLRNAVIMGHRRLVHHLIKYTPMTESIKKPLYLKSSNNPRGERFIDLALEGALQAHRIGIARDLIKNYKAYSGLDVKKTLYQSWLSDSIRRGEMALVKTVLSIKVKLRPQAWYTIFSLACDRGRADIVATLLDPYWAAPVSRPLDQYELMTSIVAAVRSGHLKVIKAVLEAGCDINAKVRFRSIKLSALQIALRKRNAAIILLLLEKGADLPELSLWPKNEPYHNMLRIEHENRGYTEKNPDFKELRKRWLEEYRRIRKMRGR